MRINKKGIVRTVFASSLLLVMSVAPFAVADNPNSSDNLDVQVELAKGLTLQCTTLDFGQIIVPLGDRGGFDNVNVDPDVAGVHAPRQFTSTGQITFTETAQRATCQISGYRADTAGVEITAIPSNSFFTLTAASSEGPTDTSNLSGGGLGVEMWISTPETDVGSRQWGSMFPTTVFAGSTPNDSSTIDFFVGATVVIPNDLVSANMGKYVGTVTITIQDGDD